MPNDTDIAVKPDESLAPDPVDGEIGSTTDPNKEEGQTPENKGAPDSELAKFKQEYEKDKKSNKEYRTFADNKIRTLTEEAIRLKAKDEVYSKIRESGDPATLQQEQKDFDEPWIREIDEGGGGTIGFVRGALKEDNARRSKEYHDALQKEITALRNEILESDPRVHLNQDKIDILMQKNLAGTKKEAIEILNSLGQLKTVSSRSPQVHAPGSPGGEHIAGGGKAADIEIDPFTAQVHKLVGLKEKDVNEIKLATAKEVLNNERK